MQEGSGFGVWGLGFGVWGLGFGVWGLGFGNLDREWPRLAKAAEFLLFGFVHAQNVTKTQRGNAQHDPQKRCGSSVASHIAAACIVLLLRSFMSLIAMVLGMQDGSAARGDVV